VLVIEYIKTVNTFSNVSLISNVGCLISYYSPQMYLSLLQTKESLRYAFKILMHIEAIMRAHQHSGIKMIVTLQCFASPFRVTFNSYDSKYVRFREWLGRNIIDASENVIVHVLTLCYQIWCARNKKYFDGTGIKVATIVIRHKNIFLEC
jgi:hypothetical protein